ncbi:MAG: fumarylacetoacetate hydrolase family protein [Proteobacteria bacterium]|nr:fumarylacetoacetate hydrolase family protein [Pseudomonadota bacterium]
MTAAAKTEADLDAIAAAAQAGLDGGAPIAAFSSHLAGFDLDQAYRVTAALRRRRVAQGARPVGRKIGFTNRTIWAEYGVYAPIWGDLYDTTVHDLAGLDRYPLGRLAEPKLEPEIAVGLARAPAPDMDEAALLDCVAWLAHGFEIVQSPFPGWRFQAPDTVACGGMHAALLLGPRHRLQPGEHARWLAALPRFTCSLACNGEIVAHGSGADVLDGPLAALKHLVALLARDPVNPPLAAGEIVTTGTLTRAVAVMPGETWRTTLDGLPLDGIAVRF